MKQKMIDFLNVFQGLRKSIVMLLLMILGSLFLVKGLLSGENFVDLLKATVISYFGANSVEHFTAMVQQHLANKSAPLGVVTTPDDPNNMPVEEDSPSPTKGVASGS